MGTLTSVSKDNKLLTSYKTAEIKVFLNILLGRIRKAQKLTDHIGFGTLHRTTNKTIPDWVRESHSRWAIGNHEFFVPLQFTVAFSQQLGMMCYFTIMYNSSSYGSEKIVRDICLSACYPIILSIRFFLS
jgi:hypothetical protein